MKLSRRRVIKCAVAVAALMPVPEVPEVGSEKIMTWAKNPSWTTATFKPTYAVIFNTKLLSHPVVLHLQHANIEQDPEYTIEFPHIEGVSK